MFFISGIRQYYNAFTVSGGVPTEDTVTGDTNTVSSPNTANVSAPTANTEYSYVFPAGTKKFLIQSRLGAKLQISYTLGATGTIFLTLSPWNWYATDNLLATSSYTIYFRSSISGDTLEVQSWA